jgi:beta-carotene ketolase (CrtW type)
MHKHLTDTRNPDSLAGILIGLLIITLWTAALAWNLSRPVEWLSPLTWLMVWVQTHLFTGLFITAHDAMHGSVAPRRPKLNHLIGRICTVLFIFNSYSTLRPKHYQHHRFVGTENDPDFHKGNARFWPWYWSFLREYISLRQLVLAAIAFNVSAIWIPQANLILYWVLPSLLSTLQLFYFGTFVPHMGEHGPDNVHKAHTQPANHLLAFLTCYFFGYHYEHHDTPMTPWWKLWQVKEAQPHA